jgi:hypothetical protein
LTLVRAYFHCRFIRKIDRPQAAFGGIFVLKSEFAATLPYCCHLQLADYQQVLQQWQQLQQKKKKSGSMIADRI